MRTPPAPSVLVDEIQSPIGRIVIAVRDGRLCALEVGRARVVRTLAGRYGRTRRVRARNPFGFSMRIRAYLAGDLAALDRIPVDAGGTPFQRRVWQALRRIRPGRTPSYGALPRAIGHRAAAPPGGAANGQHPLSTATP